MSDEKLKKRVMELEEENIRYQRTIKDISRNMLRVIKVLGLSQDDLKDKRKAKRKAIKSVGGIVMDATVDPEGIEEKFSFLGNFAKLFEENKELIEEIANEPEFK